MASSGVRGLLCALAAICALLAARGAVSGFVSVASAPRVSAPAFGSAASLRLDEFGSEVPVANSGARLSGVGAAAVLLALSAAAAAAVSRRSAGGMTRHDGEYPGGVVKEYLHGKLPVIQWAPDKIPPSKRRSVQDRIRIKIWAYDVAPLMESVECFQAFADDTGGEMEGPTMDRVKTTRWMLNKGPTGHKKSKHKVQWKEHCWTVDYYPPVQGGLESIMSLNLPHQVKLEIV
mmetsp:Transcript_12875/g.33419  ORF Transcript_12875/g.33419 Transcript_12875/m.33419 type:complete len:233 (-) Transcript_12875:107-805(-)